MKFKFININNPLVSLKWILTIGIFQCLCFVHNVQFWSTRHDLPKDRECSSHNCGIFVPFYQLTFLLQSPLCADQLMQSTPKEVKLLFANRICKRRWKGKKLWKRRRVEMYKSLKTMKIMEFSGVYIPCICFIPSNINFRFDANWQRWWNLKNLKNGVLLHDMYSVCDVHLLAYHMQPFYK